MAHLPYETTLVKLPLRLIISVMETNIMKKCRVVTLVTLEFIKQGIWTPDSLHLSFIDLAQDQSWKCHSHTNYENGGRNPDNHSIQLPLSNSQSFEDLQRLVGVQGGVECLEAFRRDPRYP